MKRIGVPCEICNTPSKYRCPACSLLSCCLACTHTHKSRLKCTGKPPITQAPVDDPLIASDYVFLEGAARRVDASRRLREGICGGGKRRVTLPYMTSEPCKRQFRFAVVTAGMERAEKNRTRYHPENCKKLS